MPAVIGIAREIAGPIISQATSSFREELGWNDVARARRTLYRQNYLSTEPDGGLNFMPIKLDFNQSVAAFNQAPWRLADADQQLQANIWARLRENLANLGINANGPGQTDNLDASAGIAYPVAVEWQRLIDMSSQGPPIETVVRNYYRSAPLDPSQQTVTQDELNYQMQRGQYRREADRRLMRSPFAAWDMQSAAKLKWIGQLGRQEYGSLLESSGLIRSQDQRFAEYLSRQIPDPMTLMTWESKGAWDADITRLLSLDSGYGQSPIAAFFQRAQGVGDVPTEFPGEPAGDKDWMALAWRASRAIPPLGELTKLQFRLRDNPQNPGTSVINGTPTWTKSQTQAALQHAGTPIEIAAQIVAASGTPIPEHMLAMVVAKTLEQPTMRALITRLYPGQADWIQQALLDHGYSPEWVQVAEAAIQQEARDAFYAEMIADKKQLRAELRGEILKQYAMGMYEPIQVANLLENAQYTREMAMDAVQLEDRKRATEQLAIRLEATKEAYLTGQINEAQVQAALLNIQVTQTRIDIYLNNWQWERTTNQKHQSTSEILATMKAGLMTPPQAIMRLKNLGWRDPDAVAEVAVVQHEMQVSQLRQLAAAQAHQTAQVQHAATQAMHQAAQSAKAAAHAAATIATMTRQQLIAAHKRLMDQSEYYGKVHAANDAYAKAEKKGNQELMDEQLAKEVAAYQRYLAQQMDLITLAPGATHAEGIIDTNQAAGPSGSSPTPGTSPGAGPAPGQPASPNGGRNAPPAT